MPKTNLGLVCLTSPTAALVDKISYRTITRTALAKLAPADRITKLREIYNANGNTLINAINFCYTRQISMYRMSSSAFPHADANPDYAALLPADKLRTAGDLAAALGIRLLSHPDQFCVLSSAKPGVITNSIAMLTLEAHVFDLIGLPESHWSPINVHIGSKGPEAIATIKSVIPDLPNNVRSRLTLENDEHKQDAAATLDVCHATGVAMLYDYHHELVAHQLDGYDHPDHLFWVKAAAQTWTTPDWQVCHLSNGAAGLHDRKHSDFISSRPTDLSQTPWLEIEAKGKEVAISTFPW
jgi:UV DNA damage endonuclease